MSKFNNKKRGTKTINKAGGYGYKESPELELVSLLLTNFVKDQFYRDSNMSIRELEAVVKKLPDFSFAAKAGIFARNEFGMRSITHVLSAIIAGCIHEKGGVKWGKSFFYNVVKRTDDITEILSYYFLKNKRENKRVSISNPLKRGLAKAFDKFDDYQIAKYTMDKKEVSLKDAINLVRPKPTEKNKKSIKKLIKTGRVSSNTWESNLTQAGQNSKTSEEKEKMKSDAWKELITKRKLGYFALLRNLRNIAEQAPDVLDEALDMLRDKKLIKKSLVLPFRFYTAYRQFDNSNIDRARDIMVAIDDAVEISLDNVPKFDGRTLVVLDDSASMTCFGMTKNYNSPMNIGALFSSVLVKTNNCDFMMFSNDAKYVNINPKDSIMTNVDKIIQNQRAYGTDFSSTFLAANKKYDRIIILSDMQGWLETAWGFSCSDKSVSKAFKEYKNKFDANPYLYSFDLQGYGTLEFPENNVFCLAGFSDKIFDIMKLLEQDKNALVNRIKKVEL